MRILPTICGPTAVGKTDIAISIAERCGYEIVSADSRQVYKYMDIGTAKPTGKQRMRVPIHMIDIVTPDILYSAADYARDTNNLLMQHERRTMVVGGSGLYIRALFEPFFRSPRRDLSLRRQLTQEPLSTLYERLKEVDPDSAERIHFQDRQRIVRALEVFLQTSVQFSHHLKRKRQVALFKPLYIGLTLPREILYERIDKRLEAMVEHGFIEEIEKLKAMGYSKELYAFNALGYREMFEYTEGTISQEEAMRKAKIKTRDYARRQFTWFRGISEITWFENTGDVKDKIMRLLP